MGWLALRFPTTTIQMMITMTNFTHSILKDQLTIPLSMHF
jgi:hypothetical protein